MFVEFKLLYGISATDGDATDGDATDGVSGISSTKCVLSTEATDGVSAIGPSRGTEDVRERSLAPEAASALEELIK